MRGRKRGCPTNVRDWQIEILHPFEDRWVRILGLNSITQNSDADTEDGSDTDSIYEEPYVKKRSASLSLEGRPIVDEYTGERDEGQALLDDYAEQIRCDGDATIRIKDAYGHAMEAVYIVTQTEDSSDTDGSTVSWDLEMVGQPEPLQYKAVQRITLEAVNLYDGLLTMDIADAPRLVRVVFEPEDASNQKFRVTVGGRVVRAHGYAEGVFLLSPLKVGEGTFTVTTVNGGNTSGATVRVVDDSYPGKSAVLGQSVIGVMIIGRSIVA